MLICGPQVNVDPTAWSRSREDESEAAWGAVIDHLGSSHPVEALVFALVETQDEYHKTGRYRGLLIPTPRGHAALTPVIILADHRGMWCSLRVRSTIGFGCMCRRMTVQVTDSAGECQRTLEY